MRVRIEQFADRQAIGGLGRREVGVGSHQTSLVIRDTVDRSHAILAPACVFSII
jgi:hypothetical protein